jgi:hypothetical protein
MVLPVSALVTRRSRPLGRGRLRSPRVRREFAGDDIARAIFYPEDDRFLVERDLTAAQYEVEGAE